MEEKSLVIFYPTPCQVIFLRELGGYPRLCKGIAYQEYIVDCQRGDVVTTAYVIACAHKWLFDVDYAIVEKCEWKPLNI